MKARWSVSALIIILTLLGVVNQQQTAIPNQEIVLQFTDVDVTSLEAQNTIAIVKKQLQDLGADNIQVKESIEGRLKITYYSEADVERIKKVLSIEKDIELGYTSNGQDNEDSELPSDEKAISYNLDVFEIQNGNDVDWDLNGTFSLEIETKSNRFSDPDIYSFIDELVVKKEGEIVKVDYKVNRNIAIAIDNNSHNIPEVRAGPSC